MLFHFQLSVCGASHLVEVVVSNMFIYKSLVGVFKFETLMVCKSRDCAIARNVYDVVGLIFLLKFHFHTSLLGPTCRALSNCTFP